MSSCLIITQGNKMYIGADTACSVKTKDGYRRLSDDMPKLFSLGQSVFFCSGRKSDAEKCVSWIYDNFKTEIDIKKLERYLKDVFTIANKDNMFNVEFLLCDYNNHKMVQLSQYNDFEPIIYNYSDELRILCGGYKTKDSFLMAKKNLILNKSVRETYKDVFESIADECVGGKVVLYNSPTSFEIISLEESNIKYVDNDNELFLLTSDFVTSGVINGSQIIGGDIYSSNYVPKQKGTYLDLINGDYQLAGGKFLYDSSTDKLKITGVDIEWSTSTTPEITDINGLSQDLAQKSASIIANANAITTEVQRASEAEGILSSSIIQTANNITSMVEANYETKTNASAQYSSLQSSINQTTTSITSKVTAVETNLSNNYSTTTQMNSAIVQSANSITSTVSATYETKNNAQSNYSTLSTSIAQTATAIESKVSKTDYNGKELVSLINQTAEAVSINANKINLNGAVTANNYFKINTDGSMEATNAKITGNITASSGNITGQLSFGASGLITHKSGNYTVTLRAVPSNPSYGVFFITDESSGSKTYPFIVNGDGSVIASKLSVTGGSITGGSINIGNGAFTVSSSGILKCTGAEVSGTVHLAKGSSLGGWLTDVNSIYSGTWGRKPTNLVFMCTGSIDTVEIAGKSITSSDGSTGWVFGAAPNFGVTKTGELYCSKGQIGNMHINTDGTLGGNGSSFLTIYPNGEKTNNGTPYFMVINHNNVRKALTKDGTWITIN